MVGAELEARLRAGGTLRIAALGDSLTYGWMVGRGYFPRACDLLERRCPDLTLERLGAGVPGDTAFGGLGRLSGLLASEPELVLVQFGLNDCFTGERVEVYRRNLERIVTGLRAAHAAPVVVTSCPLEGAYERRLAAPYYEAMRSLARELNVQLADTEAHWNAAGLPPGSGSGLWQADGVHPTDRGHQLMAEGLVAALLGQR